METKCHTGLRRYDGNSLLHRAVSIVLIPALPVDPSCDQRSAGQRAQIGGDLRHRIFRHRISGDVRGDDHARMLPERMIFRQRLLGEYIEQRETKTSSIEPCQQRILVDQRAAPGVDQRRVVGQQRKRFGVEQVPGFGRRWQHAEQHVGLRQQFAQPIVTVQAADVFDLAWPAAPAADAIPQPHEILGDASAQLAEAEDSPVARAIAGTAPLATPLVTGRTDADAER